MRLGPDTVVVPPRFDVYRAVSHHIRGIFADYTQMIEPLALDEAYLDVTENQRGLPTAAATAKEIRARIHQETGLTASAGVSYNKFLAKLASGARKPNGQLVITPDMGPDFIASLPVGKFHGVGPVTAAKMRRLGIETGADLKMRSLGFLKQHFGKSAAWYLGIANGEDDRPVVPDRRRKSCGSETTFARDLTAPAEIEAGVEAMASAVWAWCERATTFGRTVSVKVKFADFRQITRSRSFPTAIACDDLLRQASVDLVRTLLPMNKGCACSVSPYPISPRRRLMPRIRCHCLASATRSCPAMTPLRASRRRGRPDGVVGGQRRLAAPRRDRPTLIGHLAVGSLAAQEGHRPIFSNPDPGDARRTAP